jgi:hypothetical protein
MLAARRKGRQSTGNISAVIARVAGISSVPVGLLSFMTLFEQAQYANPIRTLGLGITAVALGAVATTSGLAGIVWARMWSGFGCRAALTGLVCGSVAIALSLYTIGAVTLYYSHA